MIDTSIPKGMLFARIPEAVAHDGRLSAADFRVLICLLSQPEDLRVVAAHVAEFIGVHHKTVERSLKRLVDLGYAEAFVSQTGGFKRTTDYLVRAYTK